jgi:ComF family protein
MLKNLFKLLFPTLCDGCNSLLIKNEKILCTSCVYNLPFTNHHLIDNNETKNKFYGLIDIEFACSMLLFSHDGIVQKMIHQLKYKNRQEIGNYLGELYIPEIKNKIITNKIDYIIPVPLHHEKMKKRGYNQITTFCETLSKELEIPYNSEILFRNKNTATQTKKNKEERQAINLKSFEAKTDIQFQNKHFLLVDDVITTGSTIESCAKALLKIPNTKVSIIAIAYT